MEKILNNLGKIALVLSVLAVGSLVAVVLSGATYPDMLFRVLTPVGILCTFAALALYMIQWIRAVCKSYKRGEKSAAMILLILGIAVIIFSIFRIYTK
nr:hypothetical protein [uncultured Peptoniphilus sp.]